MIGSHNHIEHSDQQQILTQKGLRVFQPNQEPFWYLKNADIPRAFNTSIDQ